MDQRYVNQREHIDNINNALNPSQNSPHISTEILGLYDKLLADATVQKAMEHIQRDADNTMKEQIELTQIPSPTFQEEERGKRFQEKLEELGLQDVQMDEVGNVFGVRPGIGAGPTLFVCGHLDTVFPSGTDVTVRERDGKYYAPGIADDGRGLAATLSLVRAFQQFNIQTCGDVIFGASVGEEALGDLRGVKHFFQSHSQVDGFISVESGDDTTYLATGSRRYQVTFRGKGGHSFSDFGTPSAIHALGRAIAMISDVSVPTMPKTTFSVGVIDGGTSVNSIAAQASMMIDLRSTSKEELALLEDQVLSILREAALLENARWTSDSIVVDIKLVGDRPAGSQSSNSSIVQVALASTKAVGFEPLLDEAQSTDSNVPISLGIPAVTLGGGGRAAGCHTLQENFDATDAHLGVQRVFLTMLGLVGIADVCEPLLPVRNGREG